MNLPMTDAQVERAAREYCRLMQTDPDERITLPDDGSCMVQHYSPRWQAYAGAVRSAAAMQAALEFAGRAPE